MLENLLIVINTIKPKGKISSLILDQWTVR